MGGQMPSCFCAAPRAGDRFEATDIVPDHCQAKALSPSSLPSAAVDEPARPRVFAAATARRSAHRSFDADCAIEPQVLGMGASGEVRLAVCQRTGRKLAVKTLRRPPGLSVEAHAALRREVEVHLSVDHPHIVGLQRVYHTDTAIYLLMEHMEGGELFERLLERKQFSDGDAAAAVEQVLRAVAYLHAHGVVHRDCKPENLLYEHRGGDHLKLVDFGFARRWTGGKKMSQRCGTLHYLAPEVLRSSYTQKADIWSIGVVAYILLTGASLYSGGEEDVSSKIMIGRPDYSRKFKSLPDDARDFVMSLLSLTPTWRPSAVSALGHPWLGRHAQAKAVVGSGIWRSIQGFSRAPLAYRAGLVALAWSLPNEDQAELRSHFLALDEDGDGVITLAELERALGPDCGLDGMSAQELLARLDVDGDGEVSWREFLAAAMPECLRRREDAVRLAFDWFDVKGRGRITPAGGPLAELLDELVHEADGDGDGAVDAAEFQAYLQLPGVRPTPRGPRDGAVRRASPPQAKAAPPPAQVTQPLLACSKHCWAAARAGGGLAALIELLRVAGLPADEWAPEPCMALGAPHEPVRCAALPKLVGEMLQGRPQRA